MSVQQRLTGFFEETAYRSIVKDAYTTRDDDDLGDTELEVAAWIVMKTEGDLVLKDDQGRLMYDRILDLALGETDAPGASTVSATELAERTELKSYRDDRGGRAASTIRGYTRHPDRLAPKSDGGLPSSHPIKRVLRRWARSQELGHFDDEDRPVDEDAAPISLEKLMAAYRLARSIASQEGFVFAPQSGDPVAVEDNERIDDDEIRPADRPLGETKAAVLLTKPTGSVYEYRVDLDDRELVRVDDAPQLPPGGY